MRSRERDYIHNTFFEMTGTQRYPIKLPAAMSRITDLFFDPSQTFVTKIAHFGKDTFVKIALNEISTWQRHGDLLILPPDPNTIPLAFANQMQFDMDGNRLTLRYVQLDCRGSNLYFLTTPVGQDVSEEILMLRKASPPIHKLTVLE